MIIKPGNLQGIYDITLAPNTDHRGYFTRLYDVNIMMAHGLHRNWVQENRSFSKQKGTIRGFIFNASLMQRRSSYGSAEGRS